MGCARCHSHKFDPITHKEFYQFFAFFNNVPERGLDGRTGNAAPLLPLPTPAQEERLDELDAAIAGERAALADEIVAPLQARVGEGASPGSRLRSSTRRPDGALRARRQLLRHLRTLSARPHGRRRSDVRGRPDRPRGVVRRRHRGQLRQRRRVRSRRRRSAWRSGCGGAATCRWPCSRSSTGATSAAGSSGGSTTSTLVGIQRWAGAPDDHASQRESPGERHADPDARAAAGSATGITWR